MGLPHHHVFLHLYYMCGEGRGWGLSVGTSRTSPSTWSPKSSLLWLAAAPAQGVKSKAMVGIARQGPVFNGLKGESGEGRLRLIGARDL